MGGGARRRQHTGGVFWLQAAVQGRGGVSDGPDLGLGVCTSRVRVGIEAVVLLFDGCEFGAVRGQPLVSEQPVRVECEMPAREVCVRVAVRG